MLIVRNQLKSFKAIATEIRFCICVQSLLRSREEEGWQINQKVTRNNKFHIRICFVRDLSHSGSFSSAFIAAH